MNIERKIEEIEGIEITPVFESKKDNNVDVDNYLKLNDLKLPDAYINFSLKYGFGQFNDDIVFKSIDKIPVGYDDGTTSY